MLEACKTLSCDYLHKLLMKRNRLEDRKFAVLKLIRMFVLNLRIKRAARLLQSLG